MILLSPSVNKLLHVFLTGSEATGQKVFGLSDETPVLQNLMCNGSEYSLSDCSGYDLNAVTGDYCLSGDYQAGIRCIQGKNIYDYPIVIDNRPFLQCLHQLRLATMEIFAWRIPPTHTYMGIISMEGELRCAIMVPTGQYVMRTGLTVKPQSSVTT